MCDVTITLKNGRVLEGRCDIIRGEPANPADPQDYRDKFVGLARRTWPGRTDAALNGLYDQALKLDQLPDMRGLCGPDGF